MNRVELIDGELRKMVSRTMFHQKLILRITGALRVERDVNDRPL